MTKGSLNRIEQALERNLRRLGKSNLEATTLFSDTEQALAEIKAIREAVPRLNNPKRSEEILVDMCQTGGDKFTMCIPVQETDSDVVLMETIKAAKLLSDICEVEE